MRTLFVLAGLLVLCSAANAGQTFPNWFLTSGATNPDVTQSNIRKTVCKSGWGGGCLLMLQATLFDSFVFDDLPLFQDCRATIVASSYAYICVYIAIIGRTRKGKITERRCLENEAGIYETRPAQAAAKYTFLVLQSERRAVT